MARIRTIKPSFFKSYKLYRADMESGYPLRLAFAGLWTVADREGRFQWIPEELKVDCLPHDEVDFSRVLDALWTRGYIDKYEVNGHPYGLIPTFDDHQIINNRESDSVLPEPNETNTLTRAAPVTHAKRTRTKRAPVEGKGKEGKGKEEEVAPAALPAWVNVDAWAKWEKFRKEIRQPLTATTIELHLRLLEKHQDQQTEIIEQSINARWRGLFELKVNGNGNNGKPRGQSAPERVRAANDKYRQ